MYPPPFPGGLPSPPPMAPPPPPMPMHPPMVKLVKKMDFLINNNKI
jgi:hypothetical protein